MLASRAMPEQPDGRRRFDASRPLFLLLLAFCLLKLWLLMSMSVDSRYAADEYVQAGASAHIGEFYRPLDPIKTVLYAYYFQLAHRVTDSAVELMAVARLQALALAVGMAALVFAVARRLGANASSALFAVLVLLSFSTFVERSFRVRADTLAAFLALAGLWVAVGVRETTSEEEERPRGPVRPLERLRPVLAGALVGAAFLSTQKAAYHALALGLGYLVMAFRETGTGADPASWLRRLVAGLGPATLFAGGWAASVLAYAIFFGGLGFSRVLVQVFTSPLRYALHGDEAYRDLWVFVYQTLSRNQLEYGLCFAGLALGLIRFRRLGSRHLLSWTVALVLTVLVMLHNQPWPYVFVLLIPFLAPWSVELANWLAPAGGSRSDRRVAVLLLLSGMLTLSFPRNLFFLRQDNLLQDRVVARAEAMLGPGDTYADGLGMIPTRQRAGERWWWDAATLIGIRRAAERGDFTAVEETFGERPKLWIVNYRVQALEPLLRPLLGRSYVPVDPNILLAGARVAPGAALDFAAPWAGRYGLYGRDGRPVEASLRVDGRPAPSLVELGVGTYRLELADPAAGEVFLLPAGLALSGPLPARGVPLSLFEGVYN